MVVTVKTFDNTNRVIRKRKAKKDRQYNGQYKKDKRTNNYLQNTKYVNKHLYQIFTQYCNLFFSEDG